MFAGDPQIIHKNRLNPGMIFGQDRKCHRQGVGGEGPALYGFEENGEYHGNIMEYPEVGRKMFKTPFCCEMLQFFWGIPLWETRKM